MLFNYHTHTKLCHHAEGETKEYVEKAIENGLKTLGFSDHAPYLFPENKEFVSRHRMETEKIFEYAETVRSLAKEYASDIRILCGFELEYYPDFHAEEKAFLSQVKPDYLLLAQHAIGYEFPNAFVHNRTEDYLLIAYVSQAIAGLSTGDFLYLAHPDMAGWNYSEEIAKREYRRLCEYAKKKNIPLEFNFLGLATNRCYPSRAFFEIASEIGNDVIFGVDAHSPNAFSDKETERKALETAHSLGLKLVEKPLI